MVVMNLYEYYHIMRTFKALFDPYESKNKKFSVILLHL